MSRITNVESYWPRRLLHVNGRSLTSVERTGDSTYGAFERPQYNILSYTWGRFESSTGEAVVIHNVPWDIPKLRPDHFTTDDFYRIIERVSQGCSHIWLDVACIDQENEATKMIEIGHQAAIFQRAEYAYIWLSHCSVEAVTSLVQQMHYDVLSSLTKCTTRSLRRCLRRLQVVLDDPWFSSLWTLQEAFLRPAAIILARDGSTLPFDSMQDVWLEVVLEYLSDWHDYMQALLRNSDLLRKGVQVKTTLAREIIRRIDMSGAKELCVSNGMQLYSISTSRSPRNPLHKIYGIMQVFGLALDGTKFESQDQDDLLDRLADLLGDHINMLSPVFAQMFIHTGDHRPKKSFSLSSSLRVPPFVSDKLSALEAKGMGSITFHQSDPTQYLFGGYICDFLAMCTFWERARSLCPPLQTNHQLRDRIEYIHLDQTTRNRRAFPAGLLEEGSLSGPPGKLNELILAEYGPEVRILLLGKAGSLNRCRPTSWGPFSWAGILAHPLTDESGTHWVRMGICIWDVMDEELELEVEKMFLDRVYQLDLY